MYSINQQFKIKKTDKLLSDYRYVRRYEIKNFDNHKKILYRSQFKRSVDLYLENNYNIDKTQMIKLKTIY